MPRPCLSVPCVRERACLGWRVRLVSLQTEGRPPARSDVSGHGQPRDGARSDAVAAGRSARQAHVAERQHVGAVREGAAAVGAGVRPRSSTHQARSSAEGRVSTGTLGWASCEDSVCRQQKVTK